VDRLSLLLVLLAAGLVLGTAGCGSDELPVAHVEGKVSYKGTPLKSGGVMFQPVKGPVAKGSIETDGTFVLSTYRQGDGATIGTHKVRIVCYDVKNQDAAAAGAHEGAKPRSLIPKKYTRAETSGLQVEVKEENDPFIFDLSD